jgi:hypothetical protein
MIAKIINDKIVEFSGIPKYYKHWAGSFDIQNTAIHEQEGFFNLVFPEFDSDTHKLGDVYFDAENTFFTYPVIAIVLPSLEDAKVLKIEELKNAVKVLYLAVQGYITEKQIHGETIPVAVKDKIKSIRTKYQLIKSQINALTTVVEVIRLELPYTAIESLKAQLEAIE